jgi:hypothetical protein
VRLDVACFTWSFRRDDVSLPGTSAQRKCTFSDERTNNGGILVPNCLLTSFICILDLAAVSLRHRDAGEAWHDRQRNDVKTEKVARVRQSIYYCRV